MTSTRREVIKIGDVLAVDFANTASAAGDPAGALRSWSDLIDFLELRQALGPAEGGDLRTMGEQDAHRCAAALEAGLRLRDAVRSILGAMATRRPLRAAWVAEINQALRWGAGASRLVRHDPGWRIGFTPDTADPVRALAPIARSMAELIASGGRDVRKCANPRCIRYFRDRSRSRRRRWCSMAVCGNRMKVAAHLRRHGRRRPA
jgi:predicted RNA-binding Zn ribbon-like protein